MPENGQLGTAKDGTPVVWVESLKRAVPVSQAKALGVRPTGRGATNLFNPEAFARSRDTVAAIDDAKKRSGFWTTGMVGGFLADKLRGSPAYNLDKDIDTLKARTAFDSLQTMRQNSPTGGALGGVAVEELKMLQAADANLDVGQSEDQLDKNLDRMRRGAVLRQQGLDPSNPFMLTEENRSLIPEGSYFRAGDGKVYRQQKGGGFPSRSQPAAPSTKFSDPAKEARYQAWLKANAGR